MAAPLSEYSRLGYASPLPALSQADAARYRDAYLDLAARLGGAPKATQLSLLHLYYDWAWELIHDPRIVDAVEQVLGPDILVWASSVFPKRAHDPGYISMHQDGTYWGLTDGQITTAWVALTPSTPENGCMRVVAGSHQREYLPHRETRAEHNLLTRGQEVEVDVPESEITDIVLAPAEMSLHDVRIIHGSNANPSATPRIGFAIRYVTPDVRVGGEDHPAVLVRGKTGGQWKLFDGPPRYVSVDEALAAHQAAAAEHLRALTTTESAAR
ncbi:MAG: phytanoyl-CoA dioxygenase family protein [Bryobacterales bacterium]|nr:phytanoyl-CoA dioxygenase family protein [Acidobacteriota bacterium]MCB9384875.1 phytanoyl-CoA dioxygenase family protein [Bryobacterales bacterium]